MSIPEETSLYWMAFVYGDLEFKKDWPFWLNLEMEWTYLRFSLPLNWLRYKLYIYDSYENNLIHKINSFFTKHYYWLLFVIEILPSQNSVEYDDEYEKNLKLNI
jgi:hypothetical protein